MPVQPEKQSSTRPCIRLIFHDENVQPSPALIAGTFLGTSFSAQMLPPVAFGYHAMTSAFIGCRSPVAAVQYGHGAIALLLIQLD
jgi:hypothetical protein